MLRCSCLALVLVYLLMCVRVDRIYARRDGRVPRDLSVNQYSESGEVTQVAYSYKAVTRSPAAIALSGCLVGRNNATVLLKIRQRSPMSAEDTRPSLELLDGFIAVSCGFAPDCRAYVNQANVLLQSHKLVYGALPSADGLAKDLASWASRGLRRDDRDGVVRPLAASLLVCSLAKTPAIFEVGNAGTYRRRSSIAIGHLGRAAAKVAAVINSEGGDLEGRVGDLVAALATEYEVASVRPFAVDVAVLLHDGRLLRWSGALDQHAALVDFLRSVRTV
jgi:20S proteasome alpha/beta subunit